MAEAVTLEEDLNEKEIARENSRQAVYQRQRRNAPKNQTQQVAAAITNPLAAPELAARAAWTKGWQYVEELVEDFALSFTDFLLFSGPAAVLIFLVRLFIGNVNNGGGTFGFRGFQIPRVPGYGITEGLYRAVKIAIIGGLTAILYGSILTVGYIVTHPAQIAAIGAQALFDALKGFISNIFSSFFPVQTP